jgi:hypothetical protein
MAQTNETMERLGRSTPEVRSTSMGASLAENIAGGGAIALAIIGLAGISPLLVASIAVIAVGAALLFEGGAVASRLSRIMQSKSRTGINASDLGGGITAEFLGGTAGLTLGVLAIVNVVPLYLVSISVVVFGAAILSGSRAVARINSRVIEDLDESQEAKKVAYEVIMSSAVVQILIALAAITLGIIAIIGTDPLILSLVALLIVGFSNLLSGRTFNVNGKMASAPRQL